jgi:hypothetical protein
MRVEYGNEEGETRPHPAQLTCLGAREMGGRKEEVYVVLIFN